MMQDGDSKDAINKPASASFTKEELRELFRLNLDTNCDTRDLVQGTSAGQEWEDDADISMSSSLQAACSSGVVSFVHQVAAVNPAKGDAGPSDLPSAAVPTNSPDGSSRPSDKLVQPSRRPLAPKDITNQHQGQAGKHKMPLAISQCGDDDIACLELEL